MDKGRKPQINGKDLWYTADHRKKPVVRFYLPLLWGSMQTGGEKLAVILSPWQQLGKL
jgi:hypothetical protein